MKNSGQNTHRSSISAFLMQQALESLLSANDARQKKQLDLEVRRSINVFLLLGITVEGVINEIGESFLDTWTWSELEKASTPLKWRIVSALKKGFDPSKEPLQTISAIQKFRNKIAHPKSIEQNDDTILISESGVVKKHPKADYKLPNENLTVFVGYENLIKDYNARNGLAYMKKTLNAIGVIRKMFKLKNELAWYDEVNKKVSPWAIEKNELGN